MRNLTEPLRTIELIAQHRYTGDVFISKVSRVWKVEFHKKNTYGNSYTAIQGGEGYNLEQTLEQACKGEIDKAQSDLESAHVFMKRVRPGGNKT